MKRLLLLWCVTCVLALASATPIKPTGTDGKPLGGAQVVVRELASYGANTAANGTYTINSNGTSMTIGVTPRLAGSVEPHVVITQGRPGSVEQGEREQRGSRLTLTTPPHTTSRIETTLVVDTIAHKPATQPNP